MIHYKKLGALFCAFVLLTAAGCESRSAAREAQTTVDSVPAQDEPQDISGVKDDPEYQQALARFLDNGEDKPYVISHVDFKLPQTLDVLHPSQDTVTTASAVYYLSGTSDPEQPLLLDGQEVQNRGAHGSFAYAVALEEGDNVFTFEQGEDKKIVTIRREDAGYALTDTLTKAEPQADLALSSGTVFTLQCVAPSGSEVSAKVNGETVALEQNAATALSDIPATFSAQYLVPDVSGTTELGSVTYTLVHNGKSSTYESEGGLYAFGKADKLAVQIVNEASSVFEEPSSDSAIVTTARRGAVDFVTESTTDEIGVMMYRLRMGGWIQAAAAQPFTQEAPELNEVTQSTFEMQGNTEVFTFQGTAYPFFTASHTEDGLDIQFFNTTGIKDVDITKSFIFTSVETVEDADSVTLHFKARPQTLWGYFVEYDGGRTTLVCKKKPVLQAGAQPLTGIIVAIDAGHGGSDTGTLGVPYDSFPMEKDITAASALALQKKLALLGADTVMVRKDDENPSMNERMRRAIDAKADFYISLHANSAGYNAASLDAKGVEVYYFEPIAAQLAETIARDVSDRTGRVNRGAKQSNYRVTMNSLIPSVLAEMGFIPNASDFDSLCDPDMIYETVGAISDGLIELLTVPKEKAPVDSTGCVLGNVEPVFQKEN